MKFVKARRSGERREQGDRRESDRQREEVTSSSHSRSHNQMAKRRPFLL